MTPIDSNPYNIANAYGVKPVRVRPLPADPTTTSTPSRAQPTTSTTTSTVSRGTDQLLAGSVNARVDFLDTSAQPAARPKGSPLAFYRHPADTNAAATSIDLGRRLDVEG